MPPITFAIDPDITVADHPFSRTWTGRILADRHDTVAPLEVTFHAPGTQITITALGGIAFRTIDFPYQDYAKILSEAVPVEKPTWDQIANAVLAELPALSRRSSYRPIGLKLGWPIPANPNPIVFAKVLRQDGDVDILSPMTLGAIADLLAEETVQEVRLSLTDPGDDDATAPWWNDLVEPLRVTTAGKSGQDPAEQAAAIRDVLQAYQGPRPSMSGANAATDIL